VRAPRITITRRGCLLGRAASLAATAHRTAVAALFHPSADVVPSSVTPTLGARCAEDGRPLQHLPEWASGKVGGVASACSAFVTRRELDAIAANNSEMAGRRDGCFSAGSRPSDDPNRRDVTRRHADQSLTAGRDRQSSLFDLPRLAALALLVGAFPAAAQDTALLGSGDPTVVQLVPRDGPGHVADVIVTNRLTGGLGVSSDVPLSIDGLTVSVQIQWGPGTVPDRVTVIVPDDCLAVPDVIDVGEDTDAVIRVFRLSGLVMG
jgi:hypothetical protein